jgi:hypothetical protein
MKLNFERDKLLLLLILTDLSFIFLHVLYMYTDVVTNYIFAIWRDRGPAEFYQYIKYQWVMILFLILWLARRRGLYLVYSLLFLYFLADDFLELHETLGARLAEWLTLQPLFGLRPQDFGELAIFLIVGSFFFALIAFFHLRADFYTRTVSKILILFIAFLAFFGIGVDMLAMMFSDAWKEAFFNFIEDGGEMLVMSGIVWFVFHLHPTRDTVPLLSRQLPDEDPLPVEEISA